MARIYSTRFLVQKGLNGYSAVVTVPADHVYVVREVTAYGSSTAVAIDVFLHDYATGAALWRHDIPGGTANWGDFEGRLVFPAGEAFQVYVDAAPIDSADVSVSGYDLGP